MTEVPTAPEPLEHLDESWQRALAVVAHPDDMEYGSAAAVARWTGQGKSVAYCLVTSGEAGIDSLPPEEAKPIREREQRAACAVVGVDAVEFLSFPDGTVEYGLELRREIAASIRRHRPDIVIAVNHRETYGGEMLNQADHVAVGRATIDAARDAGNRWVFRDLLDEGLEPWSGVTQIWVAGSPDARHGVDVTDTFDKGLESLRAHEAYHAALGDGGFDPAELLESIGRMVGTRLGSRYGVSFEVFPLRLL